MEKKKLNIFLIVVTLLGVGVLSYYVFYNYVFKTNKNENTDNKAVDNDKKEDNNNAQDEDLFDKMELGNSYYVCNVAKKETCTVKVKNNDVTLKYQTKNIDSPGNCNYSLAFNDVIVKECGTYVNYEGETTTDGNATVYVLDDVIGIFYGSVFEFYDYKGNIVKTISTITDSIGELPYFSYGGARIVDGKIILKLNRYFQPAAAIWVNGAGYYMCDKDVLNSKNIYDGTYIYADYEMEYDNSKFSSPKLVGGKTYKELYDDRCPAN